ncbi:MAG: ABC transporter permease [Planctomycetes bacterium]|nr:ABC transporter permease [Planctomycetota bacterium]
MSFWKIAWRNMQQRALASSLTGLSMALGVALMILVIVIHEVTVQQFESDAQGYHLIVGGSKGGDLQLVMTTVFHLGRPMYPIPYSYFKKFTEGEFSQYTEAAIPYCLGDSYHKDGFQFRVVATSPDLFEKISYGADEDGNDLTYEFQPGGRNFKTDHFFEAVVGSVVASKTGLKVGDTFQPTHGIGSTGDKHTEFTIVGVLAPTGTSNDRALFANLEGFYLLEDHALSPEEGAETEATHDDHAEVDPNDPNRGFKPLPEAQREVTSILVLCKQQYGTEAMVLDYAINKGKDRTAQAVAPAAVVSRLLEGIIGPVRLVLLVMTILIIVVAGISILVSIYNSMSERSHDIAVMRALGASRTAVMGIILVESILLSLLGGMAGVLLGHVVLGLASPYIEAHAGITLKFWQFNWQETLLIPGLVGFASLVGFLPALTAYRTDVGHALSGGR